MIQKRLKEEIPGRDVECTSPVIFQNPKFFKMVEMFLLFPHCPVQVGKGHLIPIESAIVIHLCLG